MVELLLTKLCFLFVNKIEVLDKLWPTHLNLRMYMTISMYKYNCINRYESGKYYIIYLNILWNGKTHLHRHIQCNFFAPWRKGVRFSGYDAIVRSCLVYGNLEFHQFSFSAYYLFPSSSGPWSCWGCMHFTMHLYFPGLEVLSFRYKVIFFCDQVHMFHM